MKRRNKKNSKRKVVLRHDIAQCYSLKSAIEQLLGRQAWFDLKECTELKTWKKYFTKLIKAIRVSIRESVKVYDYDWITASTDNLEHGLQGVRNSKNMEELLSGFIAMSLRQVFLQLGMIPDRKGINEVTLQKENWELTRYRSVQYVQSPEQIEALFWSGQQKEIGFDRQMELRSEYRASKSKRPFSKWCYEQITRIKD